MHRISHAVILALAFLGLFSCETFDRPEPNPGYVAFRNPRVELDSVTGFTSNLGIRNVWLYYGGILQNIVRTPKDSLVVVPLIDEGRTDFVIDGGIFETGQSAFNIPYPFWKPLNFTAQLVGLDTIIVEPLFEYIEPRFYDFMMNEDFEGGSINLVPFSTGFSEDSTTIRTRSNADVFHGNSMGYVDFGSGNRYFEVITADPFRLVRGRDCYAEITYKNSIPFKAGLLYQNSTGFATYEVLTITPSSEWNTIYINFISYVRQIINSGGEDTNFWLWLQADGNNESGYIQLDDIRILQRKE